MIPARRRKLLILALLLALPVLWDTTLGPDAWSWSIRSTRPDPPKRSAAERQPGFMRVLFIGNSFTRYWGGQVLIGRTAAEAAAKLEQHGLRPGLLHGTLDDLRRHFAALAALGVTWAVCAPLDIGVDSDAVELVAEARDGWH